MLDVDSSMRCFIHVFIICFDTSVDSRMSVFLLDIESVFSMDDSWIFRVARTLQPHMLMTEPIASRSHFSIQFDEEKEKFQAKVCCVFCRKSKFEAVCFVNLRPV